MSFTSSIDSSPLLSSSWKNENLFFSFPDLEMNTEFDEKIVFSHFFNTFHYLEFDNDNTNPNPFLIYKEFNYGYFEEIKLIKESKKVSLNIVLGHIKKFSTSSEIEFKKNFIGR